MSSGHAHKMRMQRYDIRDPAAGPDEFLPRVWSPTNSPLLDHGELVGVVHCVKEVSESGQLLAEVARDVGRGDPWDPVELLHTFEAVSAGETTPPPTPAGVGCRKRATDARHRDPRHHRLGQGDPDGAIQYRCRSCVRDADQTLAGVEYPGRADRAHAGPVGPPSAFELS